MFLRPIILAEGYDSRFSLNRCLNQGSAYVLSLNKNITTGIENYKYFYYDFVSRYFQKIPYYLLGVILPSYGQYREDELRKLFTRFGGCGCKRKL